jgi:hypothetical protein
MQKLLNGFTTVHNRIVSTSSGAISFAAVLRSDQKTSSVVVWRASSEIEENFDVEK